MVDGDSDDVVGSLWYKLHLLSDDSKNWLDKSQTMNSNTEAKILISSAGKLDVGVFGQQVPGVSRP